MPCREDTAPLTGRNDGLLGSPQQPSQVALPAVPVDVVRQHLVQLRAHEVSASLIAERARVSSKTVIRILQRQVRHVRCGIAAALLAVTPDSDLVSPRVGVVGTARRLRFLCALGWSLTELAERCSIPRQTLSSWCHEQCKSIPRAAAESVTELYDELYAVDGPCALTRALAKREGWDQQVWLDEDIDVPGAAPLNASCLIDEVAVQRVLDGERSLVETLTRQETAEVVRVGTASGSSQSDLAHMLGTTSRQICRIRARLREAEPTIAALTVPAPATAETSTVEIVAEAYPPAVAVPAIGPGGPAPHFRPGTLPRRPACSPARGSARRPVTARNVPAAARHPGKRRRRRYSVGSSAGVAPPMGRAPCDRPVLAGVGR